MGNKIFVILFNQGTPTIILASSISPDSCNMAFVPDLDANGMNLIDPTKMSKRNEPFSQVKPGINETEKNIAPKLKEGIKQGKNARLETNEESLLPRLWDTA